MDELEKLFIDKLNIKTSEAIEPSTRAELQHRQETKRRARLSKGRRIQLGWRRPKPFR